MPARPSPGACWPLLLLLLVEMRHIAASNLPTQPCWLQRIAVVAALKPQQKAQQYAEHQHQHQQPDADSALSAPAAASLTLEELRGWAAARLPPYELPAELRLVAAIPRNALGKVNKRALGQQVFGDAPSCPDL